MSSSPATAPKPSSFTWGSPSPSAASLGPLGFAAAPGGSGGGSPSSAPAFPGVSPTELFDFGDGKLVHVRRHPNGGGIVALTCDVAPTVYVGAGCRIWGKTRISGNVRIVGNVSIYGHDLPGGVTVQIEDHVTIAGRVQIQGAVLIRDRAEIRDNARISGIAQIMHRARIVGDVTIDGDVVVKECAYLKGSTKVISHGRRTVICGEQCLVDQELTHTLGEGRTRRRRSTLPKPIVLDTHPQCGNPNSWGLYACESLQTSEPQERDEPGSAAQEGADLADASPHQEPRQSLHQVSAWALEAQPINESHPA